MKKETVDKIKDILSPDSILLENESMKKHTTFKIGGEAEVYVEPTAEDLKKLLSFCREENIKTTIIGNGSNVLCSDKGIKGVTICIAKPMSGIFVEGKEIYAEAGALLGKVARTAASESLSGMEFAAGIPGSVGGAVLMNAGAYDGEIKDILISVDIITPDGDVLTFDASDLGLSYRHSFLMETGDIIVGARFLLNSGNESEILSKIQELNQRRIDKQPLEYPSAGSTFKRPEGYFAGKLIQDSELQGYRCGGAEVSKKHAGFVVNVGDATASDVLTVMNHCIDTVKDKYNVILEPEVRYIGEL